MLVLSRRQDQTVVIGEPPNEVTITVVRTRAGEVRLGFDAPPSVPIFRGELLGRGKEAAHDPHR